MQQKTQQLNPIDPKLFHFEVSFDGPSFSAAGDADFVFKAWGDFLEKVVAGNHDKPKQPNSDHSNGHREAPARDETREPLSVFLDRTGKTDSNPKIATAIVLWTKQHEQKEEIGPNEVKELWRRTKCKVPGNVPRELGKAVKEGWLDRVGEGRYRMTGHGEEFIGS